MLRLPNKQRRKEISDVVSGIKTEFRIPPLTNTKLDLLLQKHNISLHRAIVITACCYYDYVKDDKTYHVGSLDIVNGKVVRTGKKGIILPITNSSLEDTPDIAHELGHILLWANELEAMYFSSSLTGHSILKDITHGFVTGFKRADTYKRIVGAKYGTFYHQLDILKSEGVPTETLIYIYSGMEKSFPFLKEEIHEWEKTNYKK